MTWHGIHGHDDIAAHFRRALERGRLASSFLFVGPAGIGKRTFAMKLAQALLCHSSPEAALDPCGRCASCVQVLSGSHPDLAMIARPKDKAVIPLELLIGDKEHRMREGLVHDIGLKPFMGGRKVAVIDDADLLNVEGANCLLKTLEEPPPRSVLILIGTSPARQLPTIRSRCQLISFRPLPVEVVAELLLAQEAVPTAHEARRLAEYSEGSLQRAIELTDPALWEFRTSLLERLSDPVLDSVRLAQAVSALVDGAGREAAARRNRLRQAIAFSAEFYRHLLFGLSGSGPGDDADLARAVERAVATWPGDLLMAADCLDRCLEATGQVGRNANQATLIACWLDDLAALTTGTVVQRGP